MLGFVINPQTHHFEKTGLIYISTIPSDATVYIDGRLAHQKTPAVLRDLTPGEHFIRIELEDYNDWEENVPIIARKATVLANTLMIPEIWPIKAISTQSYQNIVAADDGRLVVTNAILKDIGLYDTNSQDPIQNLFSANSIYANGRLIHLYRATRSPFILLEVRLKDKTKFLWVNVGQKPPLIEDVSDLFPENPDRILWNNADNDNLYAFYPPNIYRINVKDKAIYPQEPQKLPNNLNEHLTINQNMFLINDKNDLLARENRWIYLYPKTNLGSPQVYNIAKSRPLTNLYFSDNTGELFYLDESGILSAVQVLPYHPILDIPIPDALRIKMTSKESK